MINHYNVKEKHPLWNSERHKKHYCKEKGCNNVICYETWKHGLGRCKSCASKGKLHPNYKGSKRIKRPKNYCIDCNRKINWQSKRCRSCASKYNWKTSKKLENQRKIGGNYKGGKPKCIDCGELIWYGSKRCQFCYGKYIKKSKIRIGKKNGMFKHGKYAKNTHYFCVDCNKEIFNPKAKRCPSCAIKGKRHPHFGKSAYKITGSYYNNIWMRSSYEIAFAFFLDCSGIKWLYESKRFYFKDCTYCPDFYLPAFDCYIEIKGWFRAKDKEKMNLFKKYYPKERIKVLMKENLQKIGVL